MNTLYVVRANDVSRTRLDTVTGSRPLRRDQAANAAARHQPACRCADGCSKKISASHRPLTFTQLPNSPVTQLLNS
jgi:hypothetical protein